MSELPGEIDLSRFCRLAESLVFESGVAAFPRLAGEFSEGHFACRLIGAEDAMGLFLTVVVEGSGGLACQRCLSPMSVPVSIHGTVRVARNDIELERFDADPEVDAIPLVAKLDPVALIEDEVLLSLPLAAMHPAGECPAVV